MNWTLGKIIKEYDENHYFEVLNTETNKVFKTLITSRVFKQSFIPEINVIFAYTGYYFRESNTFAITHITPFDENFINKYFQNLRFEVMTYINYSHSKYIDGKFQKLIYEKEKIIRELKEELKIKNQIIDHKEIITNFSVNVQFSDRNKVGDEYNANMKFILNHPDFSESDLTWLKRESYDKWTILDYRACSNVNTDYIDKIKEKNYDKKIENLSKKVKDTFIKKFTVIDKWQFSYKCKAIETIILNELNKSGYHQTFANLYHIISSFVQDNNEYFEYKRKIVENIHLKYHCDD